MVWVALWYVYSIFIVCLSYIYCIFIVYLLYGEGCLRVWFFVGLVERSIFCYFTPSGQALVPLRQGDNIALPQF